MKVVMIEDRHERLTSGRSRHWRAGREYTVRKAVGEELITSGIARPVTAEIPENEEN